MSENADFVRSIYAHWERGDFTRADWASPSIEYLVVGGPSPGGGSGLASLVAAMRDYSAPWKGYRVELESCRELDDDRLLVFVRQHGRGRGSGLDLTQMSTESANLLHVHDGRVTRLVVYWDRADALAELGLEG